MNAMTCPEVEEMLDLYAAGECDPATGARLERHLVDCGACTDAVREARRLQGMLELHWQAETGLRRLRANIDREDRLSRHKRRVLPFVGRILVAAAALLLLTFGLTGFGEDRTESIPANLIVDARNTLESKVVPAVAMMPGEPHPMRVAKDERLTIQLDRGGRTAAAYRDMLRQAKQDGTPQLPPAINLALELRNSSLETMTLYLEDHRTQLSLDLRGPDVLRLTVVPRKPPSFTRGNVLLAPGDSFFLPIRHLIDGDREQTTYLYWMEPGEYTLTMRLRVPVTRRAPHNTGVVSPIWDSDCITFTCQPIRITVVQKR